MAYFVYYVQTKISTFTSAFSNTFPGRPDGHSKRPSASSNWITKFKVKLDHNNPQMAFTLSNIFSMCPRFVGLFGLAEVILQTKVKLKLKYSKTPIAAGADGHEGCKVRIFSITGLIVIAVVLTNMNYSYFSIAYVILLYRGFLSLYLPLSSSRRKCGGEYFWAPSCLCLDFMLYSFAFKSVVGRLSKLHINGELCTASAGRVGGDVCNSSTLGSW